MINEIKNIKAIDLWPEKKVICCIEYESLLNQYILSLKNLALKKYKYSHNLHVNTLDLAFRFNLENF